MDNHPVIAVHSESLSRVECYSGFEYAQRPTAFYWKGNRLEITKVLESHRTLNGWQFQVCVISQQVFELSYNEATDEWQIRQV